MRGAIFIAQRLFLRGRRGRHQGHPLLGASMGIALSLIPLVVVDHFAAAMIEQGIIARYRETSTYHFQIRSWGAERQEEWESLAQEVIEKPGIRSAWVERMGYGLARAQGARDGLTLRSLPKDAPARDASFGRYIEFDTGSWNLNGDSILLGREAARHLDISVGDELLILTAKRVPNGRIVPRVTSLTVQGIFSTGYQDLDRTWAFISLDIGWRILADGSSRTFVGGKFSDVSQDPAYWNEIQSVLAGRWTTYDWRELNRYLLSNLESTRSILLLIMALIIVVAVLNVMTSLVMLTLEHRREIGILKCTGTSPGTISRTFLTAGAMAALTGTVIGLSGGLLMAKFINPIIAAIEFVLAVLTGIFSDGPPPHPVG